MNITALLQFAPLVIGLVIVYHLIIKQQLPTKGIGQILSYILGILVIFWVSSWLLNLFPGWANNLLQNATTSPDLQELRETSSDIIDEAFSTNNNGSQTNINNQNQQIIIVTATPSEIIVIPEGASPESALSNGIRTHTVAPNDTLFGIAAAYNTTVEDIVIANGLTTYIIQPGQVLQIPPTH